MNLTAADVAEILRLVEGSAFDELSLELDGLKLNFKRGADDARVEPPAAGASAAPAAPVPMDVPAPMTAPAVDAPATGVGADPNVLDVRSPMLGTFYRAPKPGEPPFVAVGAVVEEITIVGIIEVMKLMNAVRAEVRGTVVEFLVTDGTLVEYGEIILRVRKSV
jgi:acetyl-CoA carboxylase biotin carboxyl carrier protein